MKKIENIIIYIINYFQTNYAPADLGKVKLNKILWFADRAFMYKNYASLTQTSYIKNPQGPVVKKMEHILNKLEKANFIKSFDVNKGDFQQTSFICLREPNLDDFTAKEISILDETINKFASRTAKELSEISHDECWEKTKDGDTMPIESVFLQDIVPATKEDVINGSH
ncbi:TPA: SocA family protein [Campylobacter coli]|nr:SocA family protein [Campylobacter coli]